MIRMLLDTGFKSFFEHIHFGGDLRAEPEHAGCITYLMWPGNSLGSPRRSRRIWLQRWGLPRFDCCYGRTDPDKDEKWMNEFCLLSGPKMDQNSFKFYKNV